MLNNKYGNVLTMILIVIAVTIVGIIGYFAYDTFHTAQVNNNAQLALEEFDRATTKVKKKKSTTTSEEEEAKKQNTVSNTTNPTNTTTSLEEAMNLLSNSSTENQNTVTEPTVDEEVENEEPEKVYMEGYEVVGRIEIPKTKVDYPILGKLTKKTLEIAISVAYGPGPNKVGNTILYGHNYRNNSFFSNNKKLVKNDKVYITDVYGERVEYTIYNIYETVQSDAEYMKRDTNGRREISLQTCTNDSSGRIIVWATADPLEAPAE